MDSDRAPEEPSKQYVERWRTFNGAAMTKIELRYLKIERGTDMATGVSMSAAMGRRSESENRRQFEAYRKAVETLALGEAPKKVTRDANISPRAHWAG
jgi:hypothetical protein